MNSIYELKLLETSHMFRETEFNKIIHYSSKQELAHYKDLLEKKLEANGE